MKTIDQIRVGSDPCLQIQIDLSAMLDGELDAASVRRVMVHSDACPACSGFLRGIRTQSHALRNAVDQFGADMLRRGRLPSTEAELDRFAFTSERARELCRQLIENRRQLARILYELGRGFVLMGMSPNFSRLVAREPVPIPDVCMRGRNLLDEVSRIAQGIDGEPRLGMEWVRARDLFESNAIRTPAENMAKGRRLLGEALQLQPEMHNARIYLGHAHHIVGERDLARREFGFVLEQARDAGTRSLALLHLGNVFLEEGEYAHSAPYFLEIVELVRGPAAAEVTAQTRYASYFNLVLANGLLAQFAEMKSWLGVLHDEFPHRRRATAGELAKRTQLIMVLDKQSEIASELARTFPQWFPLGQGC
jgi:tetratricopeptide (TPR) repeat protein